MDMHGNVGLILSENVMFVARGHMEYLVSFVYVMPMESLVKLDV